MSKKLLNKVISAILVLAICSTAFLGCVVSAEGNTVDVTVSNTVVEEGTKVVASKVTITSATEFVAGIFTVKATDGLKLTGASVADTENWFVDCNTTNNKVLFQGWTDDDLTATSVTSLDITLTFDATLTAGTNYEVSVTELDITNLQEATYTVNANTVGGVHIHKYAEVGTVNGNVTVHNCIVAGCTATNSVLNEEVDVDNVEKNELNSSASLNITFTETGDLTLNFLNSEVAANTYVAVLDDENVIDKLISTGGKIKDLNAYQVPYTDGGVKAIADEVKITFIKTAADGTILSASAPYTTSIATYCKRVMDDTENNYTEKEVAYCEALLNYGKAANDYFKYENAELDELDDTYVNNYEDTQLTAVSPLYQDGNAGWYFASANVIFENKPVVRLCVNIDKATYEAGELQFTVSYADGNNSKTIGMDGLVPATKENRYYIYVRDIPAKYYSSTISIVDNVTEDTETLGNYSLETYAANKKESDIANLSRIMIAYGKALAAAF